MRDFQCRSTTCSLSLTCWLCLRTGALGQAINSDHEGKVDVFDSFSDIAGAINRCVGPVESIVTWPKLTAKGRHCLRSILDDAPAEVWLISTDLIKEII